MTNQLKSELSEKNPYYLERHRYYELKHFCLQYPGWKKAVEEIDGMDGYKLQRAASSKTNINPDPVFKCAQARSYYFEKMVLIEQAAIAANPELASWIVVGVTKGVNYDYLKTRLEIPCCKDTYYKTYRLFFWLLHKARN